MRDKLLAEITETTSQFADPAIVYDRKGAAIFFNQAARELIRRLLDRQPPVFTDPEGEPISLEPALKGTRKHRIPAVIPTAAGARISTLLTLEPLHGADGNPAGCVAILEGAGERTPPLLRDSEERIRQSEKMVAIGALASGVAHDFNNILSVVGMEAELLIGDPQCPAEIRNRIRTMFNAQRRGATLTRQLLAFSRRQPVQPQRLELNRVVNGMLDLFTRLAGEDIELSTELAPDLHAVWCDVGQVEQVLMNLVVNARDAISKSGKIRFTTWNEGSLVCMAVQDNGHGMDGETRERIFEPYFTTKAENKGTGLGLFTVAGIIQNAKGEIQVESEPGKGTKFVVKLPKCTLPEPAPPRAECETRRADARQSKATILLVEDECDLRGIIAKILRISGHEVIEARSGEDGLGLAENFPGQIDLLISDVILPGICGVELAKAIQSKRPGIRVLFLSGYTDSELARYQFRRDGVSFLQKPCSLAKLEEAVRTELQSQGSRERTDPAAPHARPQPRSALKG